MLSGGAYLPGRCRGGQHGLRGGGSDHRRGTELAGGDDRGVRKIHRQYGRVQAATIPAWSQFGRRLRPDNVRHVVHGMC